MDELETWITKLLEEGGQVSLTQSIQPPRVERRPNGWWGLEAPTLHVGDRQTLSAGRVVASTSELATGTPSAELARTLKRRLLGQPASEALALVVAPDVPWRAVATVARQAVKTGLDTVVFLFRAESALDAPESRFERWLRPPDPSAEARVLSEDDEPPSVFEHCPEAPAAIRRANRAGPAGPKGKMKRLAAAIPRGLRACACRVRPNDVRALLWAEMDRYDSPPMYALAVPLAPSGKPDAVSIALAAAMPWKAAHRVLIEQVDADEKHHLEIAP